jgi:toxin FitB
MSQRHVSGVLDTSVYLDLGVLDPTLLPEFPELTAITMAELHQGVAMAKDAVSRSLRTEQLAAATADFDPLPFDGRAATRYGSLVALTVSAGRSPRPRRLDLMIAAIASARGLPIYTRNPSDLAGLTDLVEVAPI